MKKLVITAFLGIFFAAVMSIAAGAATVYVTQASDFGDFTAGDHTFGGDHRTLTDGNTYVLSDNVETDCVLLIPQNATVTIDLNGHTIDRHLTNPTAYGNVITVSGSGALTINDTAGGGKITGGNSNSYAGGIYLFGSLTLNGGSITGNNAAELGGGIFGSGSLTMNGGSVTGNTAGDKGGGIYNSRTATMTGGSVTGNTAVYGGDLWTNGPEVFPRAEFYFSGGTLGNGVNGPVNYAVIFKANGGTGAMTNQFVAENTATALKANEFTRAGYTFIGWKDANGNDYTDKESVTINNVLTLTAQWKEIPAPEPEPAPAPVNNNEGGIALQTLRVSSAKVSGNSVILAWSKVPYAEKFTVFMTENGVEQKLKTTERTTLTVKGLKNGSTYRFVVRFTIGSWTSPDYLSGSVTITPYFKPLVNAIMTDDGAKLGWKSVPDAESYIIYKLVNGKLKKIAETTGTSALITGLTDGKEYIFAVKAVINGEKTLVKKSDLVTVKL